jgi:adenosylcobinamide-phosphate synthase
VNAIAIIVALALEQWRAFRWRALIKREFTRYARALERRLNGGTSQQGAIAALLAIGPPVVVAAVVYGLLDHAEPVLGLLWNVAILYMLAGFRHFSSAFGAVSDALKAGDPITAKKRLAAWRGIDVSGAAADQVPKLAIEQGLADSYRYVFGTLFWFLVLPGPTGAVLYRLTVLLSDEWHGDEATPMGHQLVAFGEPIGRLLYWLDWLPLRLTAVTFAVVGDFEDAIHCWRTQANAWPRPEQGILLASGAGALGTLIGGSLTSPAGELEFRPDLGVGEIADADTLLSATGMVWRAVLVWLVVLIVLTLAYWAP